MEMKLKKTLSFLMILCMVIMLVPVEAQAAKLNKKSLSVSVKKSKTLTLSGTKISKVSTNKKSVATVKKSGSKKIIITGKSEGKAVISVKGKNKKTYKCTVKVLPVLSVTKVTLNVGKSKTITLNGAKIKKLKVGISSVAKVSKSGTKKIKIVAKKKGTTTLTVTTKGGNKVKCKIVVTMPGENTMEGTTSKDTTTQVTTEATTEEATTQEAKISINQTSGVLLKDDEYQLKITGAKGSATWSSSNPNIVKVVADGTITGIGCGNSTITAKVDGKALTCVVQVVDFEFSSYGASLLPSQTYAMSVDVQGGTVPYTWESENEAIAKVDQNGNITAMVGVGGEAKIQVKCKTLNGIKAVSSSVYVKPITDLYGFSGIESNNYTTASGNVTQAFADGMNADIRLVANDFSTCKDNRFDHCNGVASIKDGSYYYYFVADTWNNRVLVYRTSEEGQWSANTDIYCVLGQEDTTSNVAGYGLNQMNWPVGVAVGKDENQAIHVYVTDTSNNRILVWNGIPSSNGAAANYAIRYMVDPADDSNYGDGLSKEEGFINRNESQLSWPWAIWTDGEKLICTATAKGYILIWNQIPTEDELYPDHIIYSDGTPRTLITDGDYMIVGDHNVSVSGNVVSAARVYNSIEDMFSGTAKIVENSGDFIYWDQNTLQPGGIILTQPIETVSGDTLPKGTLMLCVAGYIAVWKDGKINSENDLPDYYIGGGTIEDERLYYFEGGDFNQLMQDKKGNVYIACYNGCKVVGYSNGKFPDEPIDIDDTTIEQQGGDVFIYNNEYYWVRRDKEVVEKHCTATPDLCIGASNANENVEQAQYHYQNCVVDSDGTYLIATDELHTALLIWKALPDESGAVPDAIFDFVASESMTDGILYHHDDMTGIIVGGGANIYIWNDINDAIAGNKPNYYYRDKVGKVNISGISGLGYDGRYFYIAQRDGIYLFDGIPSANDEAVAKLDGRTGNIGVSTCKDGNTYVTLAMNSDSVYIYNRADILQNKPVDQIEQVISGAKYDGQYRGFNGASDVLITEDGQVMVCDQGFVRVLIWGSIADALNGADVQTTIGLGDNNYTIKDDTYNLDSGNIPIQSRNTFYSPHFIDYDGDYLWVGDFKFSGGIKRFSGNLN